MRIIDRNIRQAKPFFQAIMDAGAKPHSFQCYETMAALYWPKGIVQKSVVWLLSMKRKLSDLLRGRPIYRLHVFVILDDEYSPRMIAPVEINRCGGARSAGSVQGLNSTDFIYCREDESESFSLFLGHLHSLGVKSLRFANLREDSVTNDYIARFKNMLVASNESVAIHLHGDHGEWFSSLSKSARQNMRTAYNRLNRDGKAYAVEIYADIGHQVPAEGMKLYHEGECLYELRQKERYGNYKSLRTRITGRYGWWVRNSVFSENGFIAGLRIDGVVAAYLQGISNPLRKELYACRLSINEDLGWYSPGWILIDGLIGWLFDKGFLVLDLGSGKEKYKFALGGKTYLTRDVTLFTEELMR